jgi:hypothetical protein
VPAVFVELAGELSPRAIALSGSAREASVAKETVVKVPAVVAVVSAIAVR